METKILWPTFKVLGHTAAKCGSTWPGLEATAPILRRKQNVEGGEHSLKQQQNKSPYCGSGKLHVDILQLNLPSGVNCLFLGWVVSTVEF